MWHPLVRQPLQCDQAYDHKRQIRQDIPRIRNSQPRPDIDELVIRRILVDRVKE